MKRNKTAAVMFTIMLMTCLTAKAENMMIDFDGVTSKNKGEFSLQDTISSAAETSGISIPNIPTREYISETDRLAGDSATEDSSMAVSGRPTKIFLKSKQDTLKAVLLKYIAATPKNTEVTRIIKTDGARIIFDTESIYVTSNEYDIYLTITDAKLYKDLELSKLINTRGKCRWVKKYIRQCGTWGQTVCLIWDLIEIVEEVCDALPEPNPTTPSPGGGSGGTYTNGQGGDSNYDVNKHLK